jgi:hypothetical protein
MLVVWMLMTFDAQKEKIEEFGVAFGIVMGFVGLLDILWRVWIEVLKSKSERPSHFSASAAGTARDG